VQFKTDEDLPVAVAEALRDAGIDALTIHDQKLVGNVLIHLRIIPASSSCVHAIKRSQLFCV